MKPSGLSVATGSTKRARSQDSRPKEERGSLSPQVESANMKPQMPKFLAANRKYIHSCFEDLDWKQKMRISHARTNAESPWKLDVSATIASRNRYMGIQPWANSRIMLKVPEGQSDYVNASPILLLDSRGNQIGNKYIATQGPKDTSHFWHMVLQETQEPAVVVMLTQTVEGNREKCAQYYPLSMEAPSIVLPQDTEAVVDDEVPHDPFWESEKPLPSGSLTLLELNRDLSSRCEVRKLNLVIGDESRTVYHYLFVGWPDFTKPEGEDRQALMELIKQTGTTAGNTSTNPRIVHCSAGVGRTGTFIALDYLLKELEGGALDPSNTSPPPPSRKGKGSPRSKQKNGSPSSDAASAKDDNGVYNDDIIYQTVKLLREQRMMMVMNEIQYSFIYEVLKEKWEEKYLGSSQPRPGTSSTTATSASSSTTTPAATSASAAPSDASSPSSDVLAPEQSQFDQSLPDTEHNGDSASDHTNSSSTSAFPQLQSGERSPKIARKNSQLSQLEMQMQIRVSSPGEGNASTSSDTGIMED